MEPAWRPAGYVDKRLSFPPWQGAPPTRETLPIETITMAPGQPVWQFIYRPTPVRPGLATAIRPLLGDPTKQFVHISRSEIGVTAMPTQRLDDGNTTNYFLEMVTRELEQDYPPPATPPSDRLHYHLAAARYAATLAFHCEFLHGPFLQLRELLGIVRKLNEVSGKPAEALDAASADLISELRRKHTFPAAIAQEYTSRVEMAQEAAKQIAGSLLLSGVMQGIATDAGTLTCQEQFRQPMSLEELSDHVGKLACGRATDNLSSARLIWAVRNDARLSDAVIEHASWLAESMQLKKAPLGRVLGETAAVGLILSLPAERVARMIPTPGDIEWLTACAYSLIGTCGSFVDPQFLVKAARDGDATAFAKAQYWSATAFMETEAGRHFARHLLDSVEILKRTADRIEKLARIEAQLGRGHFAAEAIGDLLDWFVPVQGTPAALEWAAPLPAVAEGVAIEEAAFHLQASSRAQGSPHEGAADAAEPADEAYSPEYWRAVWDGYTRAKAARLTARRVPQASEATAAPDAEVKRGSAPEAPASLRPRKQPGSKNRHTAYPHHPPEHDKHLPKAVVKERIRALNDRTTRFASVQVPYTHGVHRDSRTVRDVD